MWIHYMPLYVFCFCLFVCFVLFFNLLESGRLVEVEMWVKVVAVVRSTVFGCCGQKHFSVFFCFNIQHRMQWTWKCKLNSKELW